METNITYSKQATALLSDYDWRGYGTPDDIEEYSCGTLTHIVRADEREAFEAASGLALDSGTLSEADFAALRSFCA